MVPTSIAHTLGIPYGEVAWECGGGGGGGVERGSTPLLPPLSFSTSSSFRGNTKCEYASHGFDVPGEGCRAPPPTRDILARRPFLPYETEVEEEGRWETGGSIVAEDAAVQLNTEGETALGTATVPNGEENARSTAASSSSSSPGGGGGRRRGSSPSPWARGVLVVFRSGVSKGLAKGGGGGRSEAGKGLTTETGVRNITLVERGVAVPSVAPVGACGGGEEQKNTGERGGGDGEATETGGGE